MHAPRILILRNSIRRRGCLRWWRRALCDPSSFITLIRSLVRTTSLKGNKKIKTLAGKKWGWHHQLISFSPVASCPALSARGNQIPRWLGSDPLSAWWLGLAPATLEFWVRFTNERNQEKQAHPVLKYRDPHGSHPPPREQLCNRYCSNKHTRRLFASRRTGK